MKQMEERMHERRKINNVHDLLSFFLLALGNGLQARWFHSISRKNSYSGRSKTIPLVQDTPF